MTTEAPPEAHPAAEPPAAPAPRRRLTTLSRTAAGRPVPPARERAAGRARLEDPLISWSAAIGITVLAFVMRVWNLGDPHKFAFDETYYAKDAWSLLHYGHAQDYVDSANDLILGGTTTGVWKDTASMAVHPDGGKWLIALGEHFFGMDPFGWRIASAVVGSLMVLVMCRLGRRLTGSTLLGCVAGLLLMFDGLHFVLSRLALLDIFVAFWLLCAVACVVNDRDWFRAKLGRLAPDGVTSGFGPVRGLLFRPWLLLAGICFGLAIGTKWTALYPLAAFGLLVWAWCWGARRSFGVRWPVLRSALVDGLPAFVHLVVIGAIAYLMTWTGWLMHANDYERDLSSTQYTHFNGGQDWPTASEPDASGLGEVWQSMRSLAHYHRDVYVFHTQFLNDATHTYQSQPSGWPLLNRGVGVDADTDIQPGEDGCTAPEGSNCLRQILLLGTPALWWGGCLAMLWGLVMWIGARDWRWGVPIVGLLSGWLPWMQYDDRPIFLFYAIVLVPFLALAATLAMGQMIGTSREPSRRRTLGVVAAGSFFVLVLANFAWFWPIYTDGLLTHSEWLGRIWFKRWV
ncbi:dolichyl-phosphate-mannose--protein mannosyltransferase [Nocardioides taihuensis]|uniref:Polyprenol-phosphate-mannose--protein mannosyltransferase n=1 Tax=Nocardioides taihuensis TaxID=1835606 RepID=A0ABW0BM80_9ACTN